MAIAIFYYIMNNKLRSRELKRMYKNVYIYIILGVVPHVF